jgi:hypothetical protein
MAVVHIHQIFYSSGTREALDRGFAGLDNMKNDRPDWREYWPIRNYLLNTPLTGDAYYGFFSPKFGSKTNLGSTAVYDFIHEHAGSRDVFLFSPFFDQIAYPANIFEQGALQHADTLQTFRECVARAAPGVDFNSLIMDSTNTVFCNYFVAKPAFWRIWLEKCELIFRIAEEGTTDLAKRLNAVTSHDGSGVPMKVFVLERMASLILSTEKHWRVKSYNPLTLPWSKAAIASFRLEMAFLDALKIAHASQGHQQYLDAFYDLRRSIGRWLQKGTR